MAKVNLRKRDNGYHYLDWRDPITGKRIVVSTGSKDGKHAEHLHAKKQREVDLGELGIPNRQAPLAPLIEEHLAWHTRQGHAKKHADGIRRAIEAFCEQTKARTIADLTVARAERYANARRDAGAHHNTVRLELVFIKGFGRWLQEQGKLPYHPLALLKPGEERREDIYAFSSEQRERFIAACPERAEGAKGRFLPLRDMALVAFYAGLRQGEILNLVWTDVELEGKTPMLHLRVRSDWAPKRRKSRQVPLHPVLVEMFRRRVESHGGDRYVFGESVPVGKNDAHTAWKRVAIEVGLPDATWVTARHTFATLALSAGVPIFTVSHWMGHASVKVTEKYYGRYVPEDHAKWIGAI